MGEACAREAIRTAGRASERANERTDDRTPFRSSEGPPTGSCLAKGDTSGLFCGLILYTPAAARAIEISQWPGGSSEWRNRIILLARVSRGPQSRAAKSCSSFEPNETGHCSETGPSLFRGWRVVSKRLALRAFAAILASVFD